MAVNTTILVHSKYVESIQTVQYTATAVIAIIDKFTVTNVSSSNVTFNLNIVEGTGSASNSNLVINSKTIPPGYTYNCPEAIGQVLVPNAYISTLASQSNSLSMRVSGREIV